MSAVASIPKRGSQQLNLPGGLNQAQWQFVQGILDGLNATQAYMAAYPDSEAPTACASRLLTLAKVKDAIKAGRDAIEAKRVLTRQSKREFLALVVQGDEVTKDKLKAIEIDNRMSGDDAPTQVNHLHILLQGLPNTTGLPHQGVALEAKNLLPGNSPDDREDRTIGHR